MRTTQWLFRVWLKKKKKVTAREFTPSLYISVNSACPSGMWFPASMWKLKATAMSFYMTLWHRTHYCMNETYRCKLMNRSLCWMSPNDSIVTVFKTIHCGQRVAVWSYVCVLFMSNTLAVFFCLFLVLRWATCVTGKSSMHSQNCYKYPLSCPSVFKYSLLLFMHTCFFVC